MLDHRAKILPALQSLELFRGYDDEKLEAIADNSSFVRTKAGELVFAEGDVAAGAFFVSSGIILMKKTTAKDKQIVTELLGAGDPYGLIVAVQKKPYPLSAEAMTETVSLKIEQDFLEELVAQDSSLNTRLVELCTERIRQKHSLIALLADANSETRVAAAILIFYEKFGAGSDSLRSIEITRQALSSIAGIRVETCIRVTRNFENQGILSLPHAGLIEIKDYDSLLERCQ